MYKRQERERERERETETETETDRQTDRQTLIGPENVALPDVCMHFSVSRMTV